MYGSGGGIGGGIGRDSGADKIFAFFFDVVSLSQKTYELLLASILYSAHNCYRCIVNPSLSANLLVKV